MIKLTVELQDFSDNYNEVSVILPSYNLDLQLHKNHEYVIIDCHPYIKLPNYDDVFKLNKILQQINDNNDAISNELLSMFLDVSPNNDLYNLTFIENLVNDDFYFKEIKTLKKEEPTHISAAKFLFLSEKIVPNSAIPKSPSTDIEWSFIWNAYENMGFKIISGKHYNYDGIFVTYWL